MGVIKTNNKRILFMFACIFICMFVVMLFLQASTDEIYASAQIERYSDDMELLRQSDVTMSEGMFEFSGKNPCVEYGLSDDFYYVNALIRFEAPLENSEKIILDYAGNDGEYTYWGGDTLYLNKGVDYVIAPLSTAWDIKTVKISIEPSLYDYPSIKSVSLQRTGKLSKLSLILAWFLKDYILVRNLLLSFLAALALSVFFEYADTTNKKNQHVANGCAIVVIIAAVLALYQNYIWGSRLFIFNDCAGDSAGMFYPSLVNMAKWADAGVSFGAPDFSKGLGDDVAVPIRAFTYFISVWGEDIATSLMVVYQVCVTVISGICIYYVGVLYSNNRKAAICFAVAYMFCSEYTIRASWPSYGYTMMFISLWLLAFELLYAKKAWFLIPIPTMLLLSYTDTFFQVLWIVLLIGYIFVRFMMYEGNGAIRKCIAVEGVFILLVFYFQNNLIRNIINNLQGERFQNGISKFINSSDNLGILKAGFDSIITSKSKLLPGFLRTIGQNIGGITINYRGGNYLLDLTLYCGIAAFIFVPVALYNMSKKKRRSYGVLIISALAYVFVYPVTMLMTAFTGLYKLSSQWIIITILFVSIELISIIMMNIKLRKGSMIILGIMDVAVLLISVVAFKEGYVLSKKLLLLSLLFVLLYSAILFVYDRFELARKSIGNMLIVLILVEGLTISWNSFNDRITFSKDYNPYYDDGMITAMEYLNNMDDDFYRIEKQTPTVEDNDALIQGYFGTRLYSGGGNYLKGEKLYQLFTLPYQPGYRLKGTASDLYAMTMLGVRYYVSKDNIIDKYGYKYLNRVDGLSIYKSEFAMPVAYATDKVFDKSDIMSYDAYTRKYNLIGGAVVSDEAKLNIARRKVVEHILDSDKIYLTDVEKDDDFYYPVVNNRQVLLVCFDADKKIDNAEYIYRTSTGQEEIIYFGAESGKNILEVCVDNLEAFGFNEKMDSNLKDICFYIGDREEYYAKYRKSVADIDRMTTVSHNDDYSVLEGVINVKSDGVLVTQYYACDIIIDDVIQDTFVVNDCFVGCNVNSGTHKVRLERRYDDCDKRTKMEGISLLIVESWLPAILVSIVGTVLIRVFNQRRRVGKND